MTKRKKGKSEPVDDLIEIGSDIAGGTAGAALGFFTAGPAGAVLGGATAPLLVHTFRKMASEIRHRYLGVREEVRIGATIAFAARKIQENIANGQQIRQDGFFETQPGERAAAEEVLEALLLVAQREHQEKKLPFYGNLLANIAFHHEIDRAYANLLIRLGDQISYRQMCLLVLFASQRKDGYHLRQEDYRSASTTADTIALLQEIYELYSQGMLNASGEALLGIGDVKPAKMKVQGTGAMLCNLMELWRIESLREEDLIETAILLR
jgi:hypothetical protein